MSCALDNIIGILNCQRKLQVFVNRLLLVWQLEGETCSCRNSASNCCHQTTFWVLSICCGHQIWPQNAFYPFYMSSNCLSVYKEIIITHENPIFGPTHLCDRTSVALYQANASFIHITCHPTISLCTKKLFFLSQTVDFSVIRTYAYSRRSGTNSCHRH